MRSIEEAKQLLKAGDRARALPLCVEALKIDRNDVDAWWLLSFAVAEREQQIYAVRRVIVLSPGNPKALARLAKLEPAPGEELTPVIVRQMPASAAVTATRSGRVWAASLGAGLVLTIAIAAALTFSLSARAAQEKQVAQVQAPTIAIVQPTEQPSDTPEQLAQQITDPTSTSEQLPSPTTEQALPSPTSEPLPTAEPTSASDATVSLITDQTADQLPIPAFDQFVASVANGKANQRVGVFVENRFSFPIVQQPADQPAFIDTSPNVVTDFRIVHTQTGNEGLIAHNYLAGGQFYNLQVGDIAEIVLGDGSVIDFEIMAIEDYQALTPTSPTSDFLDLATGAKLSASDLFYRVYGGDLTLTFQTCITRNNNSSWGRTFIIGEEL